LPHFTGIPAPGGGSAGRWPRGVRFGLPDHRPYQAPDT